MTVLPPSGSTPSVSDLARQLEEATYLGSCDWGSCSNDQVGWARCACDECAAVAQEITGPWLAICDPCRKRGDTKDRGCSHPVAEFVSFAQVWRRTHGEALAAAARRAAMEVPDA